MEVVRGDRRPGRAARGRFDRAPERPGAELEASRGCPYRCTFCAKESFRDRYRKRPLSTELTELDALIAAGVEYVYFVDEIFLPDEALLLALAERSVEFGVQMRVDLLAKLEALIADPKHLNHLQTPRTSRGAALAGPSTDRR